jgi:hypothetical protein
MVEEAWHTKMMISKLRDKKNETNRVENRGQKKELIEVLSRLNNLEASVRRIEEDQRNQSEKMERLARKFQIYLHYVHHMDITPVDRCRTPTCIRKTRTVEQKKENEARKEGDESHPILLDQRSLNPRSFFLSVYEQPMLYVLGFMYF